MGNSADYLVKLVKLLITPPTIKWCHNEGDGVSNHWLLYCLLNCWFRHRSKKTPKLCVTGFCEGNSPVTGEFPSQRASNAENVNVIMTSSCGYQRLPVFRETAYLALLETAELRDGDTVIITSASGAVGNVMGQIARMKVWHRVTSWGR